MRTPSAMLALALMCACATNPDPRRGRSLEDVQRDGYGGWVEVDLVGARNVVARLPEAITVFLAPPSWDELVAGLTGRATETPEAMARRLETARAELAAQGDFDEVVVNSQLESACAELVSLLVAH